MNHDRPRLHRRPARRATRLGLFGRATRLGLFAALGWQTVKALDETFGASAVRARLPALSRTQRRGSGRGGL